MLLDMILQMVLKKLTRMDGIQWIEIIIFKFDSILYNIFTEAFQLVD